MAIDTEQKRRTAAQVIGLPTSRKPFMDLDTASGRRTVLMYDFTEGEAGPEVSLVSHGGVAAAKRPLQRTLSSLRRQYELMWKG